MLKLNLAFSKSDYMWIERTQFLNNSYLFLLWWNR